MKRLMPKIVIKEFEVDANLPIIEEGNLNVVVKTFKQMLENRHMGGGMLSIQQKCGLRTMKQVQKETEYKYRIKR